MKYHIPRGTADVLPKEAELWDYIEVISKDVFKRFNYKEIKTPIFEHTEIFQRGVGETTDIVEKEMYTFIDKGDRSLTLRPEGTASVVRSFVENKMYASPDVVKLYYIGPMFRYERPQSGRSRQFTQVGVEAFGSNDSSLDVEVISMAMQQFKEFGFHKFRLDLNSVGCPSCREIYREKLIEKLQSVKDELCKDCQSRLERNPMRILDCKNENCKSLTKDAPLMIDYLCDECKAQYDSVKSKLDIVGIPYVENPRLVRGLDYYTQTAFEIIAELADGGEGTLCGGGRYNKLVEQFGGNDVPGIGYAFSLERIIALKAKDIVMELDNGLDVFVIAFGEVAKVQGAKIVNDLRINKISADLDYLDRKMKTQMKAADRLKAKKVVILGEDELNNGKLIVRNMATGLQEDVVINNIVEYLSKN